MSRKLFTEENIAELRKNTYVYSVTSHTLVLRKEFKEIFYREYMEGAFPREIFSKYGFNPEILGSRRMAGAARHIKEEYAKYGGFHEGPRPSSKSRKVIRDPVEADLKRLREEVEYLHQEIDFLKKIASIRNSAK